MRKLEQGLAKLHAYVREHNVFPAGAKLLLCCSGGSDSVALLHLFSRLRSLMQITLLAVHVDHQLRGAESDADAELVKEQCQHLNIPVLVRKVLLEGGAGLENQARNKRQEVFQQLLELYRLDYYVTAHHNNDQAETMLLNLCRGAGLNGLAGIKPRSGKAAHPLLPFSKEELRDILREEGIPWREDSSNLEQTFRRNWVRHTLLPLLEQELNPRLGEKLGLQAQIFAEAEALVLQRIKPLLKKATLEQGPDRVCLAVPVLERCGRLEQYYLLRAAVFALTGSERDFFSGRFADIVGLFGGQGTQELKIGGGLTARRQYGELLILREQAGIAIPEEVQIEEDRSRAVWGEYRFTFRLLKVMPQQREEDEWNVFLDADKISFPFSIRARRPGDRFVPLGMQGHKRLKEFFIDAKVPRPERDLVPIFDDGSKIFWVGGYRLDERAAIGPESTRFLHISAEHLSEKPMRAANRNKRTGE